ncbi:MAG TPA: hypothetical protein VFK19_10365 [Sphingomicrobium sp.]|nr:hypothetical protein [Sphingomicrobium sp.]
MAEIARTRGGRRWRLFGWGAAIALLAAPFVAMQLNAQGVGWSAGDFIVMGAMLGTVGGLIELVVHLTPNRHDRTALGLALLGAFLTVWVNLAVGIVGSENNPNNQLFFVALLMGVAGAIGGRFKPDGMARTMLTTAAAIALAFLFAQLDMRDEPMVKPIVEGVGTSLFVALFLGSAWLFRRAAIEDRSSR